ncbi:MAG: YtxH domain-containing protein [Bryobacter sp.]|nr:YtxH domain-containing protein [Bryobacter sp.]
MANDRSQDLIWFFAGAALGATVGLLLAPAAGEETRKRIGGVARKGRETVRETGERIYKRGRELFETGRAVADEAAEIFESGRRLVQD